MLIVDIYCNNKIKIQSDGLVSQPRSTSQDIRQGDFLSTLAFDLIIKKIIPTLEEMNGYQI